jgi:hypothetical protein
MGGKTGGGFQMRDLSRLSEVAKQKLKEANTESSPHVFISFAFEDIAEVNLLRGQAKNDNVELNFDDYSVKEAFDSSNSDYIKGQIREKIERVSVTVVFLSDHSAKSKWVNWEIEESVKMGKGVVCVYSGDRPKYLPAAVDSTSMPIVAWKHEQLMVAIARVRQSRGTGE